MKRLTWILALLLAPTVKAVVNPNVGAERFKYPSHVSACGARYATIRSRFTQLRQERNGGVQTILVGLGGTGNLEAWPRIRAALRAYRGATLILYGHRPHPVEWYAVRGCTLRAVHDYAGAWEAFAQADLAIVGAGVTALECLHVGIPTILYAPTDAHQPLLYGWRSYGFPTLSRDIGRHLDPAKLRTWSQQGIATVDGVGADRVLDILVEVAQ